jgi:hypothetical protein
MIAAEPEKWRERVPSRWVVFAVVKMVRGEAWVKRRMGDSVAVLELAGCCLSIRNTMTADGEDSNYA